MDSLAARIARVTPVGADGEWQRHVASTHLHQALEGRRADGRWGTKTGFPVLYLGRPTASVTVEAYRHLVDPVMFDSTAERDAFIATLQPRSLVTCRIKVSNLLDLRSAGARSEVGLTIQDLTSDTYDKTAYAKCQEVALVAHQLRLHGVIAPSATKLGETLALFMDVLPAVERPVSSGSPVSWTRLPDDPRDVPAPGLRIVHGKH